MTNPASSNRRTAARALVDALRVNGVDTVFCVPGESYLAVLDALHDVRDAIRVIVCRQEGGAAYMAEAYGKLTGKPGIVFVTRGPGLSNALVGLHTAQQDSTPLILFMGQIARDDMDREAFQEVDLRRNFAGMVKWTTQIDRPERVPELVGQAFHRAVNGRPGPVMVALPEDMLVEEIAAGDSRPHVRAVPHPGAADMARLRDLLARAERPFLLVGGAPWSQRTSDDLKAFAEANALPVGTGFRCFDYFDNDHACYVGDVGLAPSPQVIERIKDTDLLIVVGSRIEDTCTAGYTRLAPPTPHCRIVHVQAGGEELGRVYHADLPIHAAPEAFAAAARALEPVAEASRWRARTAAMRAEFEAWQQPVPTVGDLQMAEIVHWLQGRLPEDAIVTNGAGNYAGWFSRYLRPRRYRSQLGPTNGSMGYGVPAGIAAKLACPDRMVVSVSGDGCFMMNGQELSTAVAHALPVIFLVVNNGMYGTIRMHQERDYPARVIGTDLVNPDFAALARAYGAHGETVSRTDAFAPAFERAVASGGPALIELKIDPEAITTSATLSGIRAAAQKRLAGA